MLIAGNWKMYKGPAETAEFCVALRERELPPGVDVVLCPPFVSLAVAVQLLAGTDIAVAAQNVHWEREGAFTGEISAPMLREVGVYGAIVGHSERRQYFGETDETVARRARAALDAGLSVIACVGETEAEREAGETEEVLRRQVSVLERDEQLVVAYEPVWAIGTGKTATPELAQEAHAFIKSLLDVPVLYGGSVKPDNAAELLGAAGRRRSARRRRLARRRLLRRDLPRRVPLVALVVLDGWGCAPPGPGNAVERRRTRRSSTGLWREFPHSTLEASGEAAGLPPGQMGNSEVGHLTIGAGRRLYQDLMRVNKAIEDGSFFENRALRSAFERGAQRAPARPRLLRRRPLAHRPPARAARPSRRRRRGCTRSRTGGTCRPTSAVARPRRAAARADRDRRRPLLRDGPRQALGENRTSVRRDRAGSGYTYTYDRSLLRLCASELRRAASPTSSSSRSSYVDAPRLTPERHGRLLQLPP